MKLETLLKSLEFIRSSDKYCHEKEVGIVVNRVGAGPCIPVADIKNISSGIDWDSNKIHIYANEPLYTDQSEKFKQMLIDYDKAGYVSIENLRLKRENSRVKRENKLLKERLLKYENS